MLKACSGGEHGLRTAALPAPPCLPLKAAHMNHPLNPSIPSIPSSLAQRAAEGVSQAASDLMDGARPAVQALRHGAHEVRVNAAPASHEWVGSAEDLARDRLHLAREQALQLRDSGMDYARGHPVQTLLLAAALGAGLVLAWGLLSGGRRSR